MSESPAPATPTYPEDVQVVHIGDREFILVGTAHISQQSADLVRQVIETEQPDCVCVELDVQRYKSLSQQRRWESLDLKAIIKQKQLSTLLINLVLSSYQKRMGQKLGVMPGAELLEATRVADSLNIPVELCDRDVRTTLRRAWNSMSFWDKIKLLTTGGGSDSIQLGDELTEDDLARIRRQDVLTELITELGEKLPTLKKVLIDERDTYLAQKMMDAPGKRLVGVVGAGHVQGIIATLKSHQQQDLAPLEVIPPVSPVWKWIGWGIPAIILASLAYIGYSKGGAAMGDNALFWFLANGIPSALGVSIALAHPLTIVAAFLSAPFTSLTPVIGAGYVAAFVQLLRRPPVVKEFQSVSEDVAHVRNWWSNHLLRIFLVFLFTSVGSMIGTYVGLYEIISNLF